MKSISLRPYAPIISNRARGKEILDKIMALDPLNNEVTVDMTDIISMTTYCAKQIFGTLYKELGGKVFQKNIILKNVSEDVYLVIRLGIDNVIKEL